MDASELQSYLHDHIPLTSAMGVSVRRADEGSVVLEAPLAPNVNHRNTAFGGSIGALATVAAWSWLHVQSRRLKFDIRLVIRSNTVEYLAPVEGDFVAICESPGEEAFDSYRRTLIRKGRARIEMAARVEHADRLCATFTGTFAGLRSDAP